MDHQRLIAAKKVVQRSHGASEGGAQSIDRAATLLLLVGRAGVSGARLADLVAQSELSKPTVRRMLLALVRSGLLDQDETTRTYYIGPEIYALGTLVGTRFGIHGAALRSLVRLSQQSGDTAFLSVPRDVYSICLHREDGSYPIRVQALQAGDRHPLGVGAGSLAMLAAMTDAEIETIIAANIADGSVEEASEILRGPLEGAGAGDAHKRVCLEPGHDAGRLLGDRGRNPRRQQTPTGRALHCGDRAPDDERASARTGATAACRSKSRRGPVASPRRRPAK